MTRLRWFLVRLTVVIVFGVGLLALANSFDRPAAAACNVDCDTTTCSVVVDAKNPSANYSVFLGRGRIV
jgi:hypothetical protein